MSAAIMVLASPSVAIAGLVQATMDDLKKAIVDQLEPVEIPVRHYFGGGVYARVIDIPKGTVLVGDIHKHTNINLVLKGHIEIRGGGVAQEFKAGDVIVSPPGTQRAGYALEDTVWATVHGTDETDLEKIRAQFICSTHAEYLEFCESLKLEGGSSCLG